MKWLYLMKWSYKKFLYLRLELFRILNEWLRKRPFRLWDVSPTYWAQQPLVSHVMTYIKFELFQSTSLSIWMPYLVSLIEDVIVDLHEIWWHAKHLLALHMDILEKPSVNTISKTKGLCSPTWVRNRLRFRFFGTKVKGRKSNFSRSKQLFTRNARKMKWRYRRHFRGVSKVRGNLCLQLNKFVAILRFRYMLGKYSVV